MFNNVICYSIDANKTVEDSIFRILGTDRELELKNKYYESTLRLIEASTYLQHESKTNCLAIILYANGQTLTTGQLDEKVIDFKWVGNGPRIIICDRLDDECPSYKSFLEWSIKNEFDLILAEEEDARKQIVDSLSAFHWPNVKSKQVDDDPEKELMDFESILNRIKSYRNLPHDGMNDKLDEIRDLFDRLIDIDEDQDDEKDEPADQEETTKT